MNEIRTKQEMYVLFGRGVFGNAGLNFPDLAAAMDYHCRTGGLIAIRTKRAGGGPFLPDLDGPALQAAYNHLRQTGWTDDQMQFSAMMPDHCCILQGFAMRSPRYIELDYNDVPGINMREAMKHPKHAHGMAAMQLIRSAMDATSWDNLQRLWDMYPDAVIEFSCYPMPVGNLGWNTVFWEVRNYG